MSITYTQNLQISHTTCYSYIRWKVLHVGSRMVLSGRVFTPDRLRDVNFCDVSDGGRGWWYYVGDGAIWPILSRQYLYGVIYLRYVQRGRWWQLLVAAMEADVDHGWLGEDVCEQKNSSGKRAGKKQVWVPYLDDLSTVPGFGDIPLLRWESTGSTGFDSSLVVSFVVLAFR